MKTTHLKHKDYKKMPWKNGRGMTTEIAIFPPSASLQTDDFMWRLSSADITEDSSFSFFPDCNRQLAIIEGAGVELSFPNQKVCLRPNSVLQFSGQDSVACKLLAGPVKDLNLIFKAKLIQGQMNYRTGPNETLSLAAGTHLFFVASGSLTLLKDDLEPVAVDTFDAIEMNVDSDEIPTIRLKATLESSYFHLHLLKI